VRRVTAIAALSCALFGGTAAAQPYSGVTPVPRTTDAAALHALASDREIGERIRLGIAALARAAWPAARDEFARALALHPPEPQGSTASYDLGIALTNAGDLDGAARAFEAAIALDRGFLAARANLVSVHLLRGDLAAARAAADAYVALAPDSARAAYARGIAALRAGDATTALADFRRLLARDPKYAVAHYDLALAEQRLGDYAAAERELRAALALVPAYARANIALGAVLLHEGNRADARAAFDAALRDTDDATLRTLATSLRDAIGR